jgi:hypothetical protein
LAVVLKLGRFLDEVNVDTAQRQDIELFLLQFGNAGNRHAYYRAIKTFYSWREETFDLPSPRYQLNFVSTASHAVLFCFVPKNNARREAS